MRDYKCKKCGYTEAEFVKYEDKDKVSFDCIKCGGKKTRKYQFDSCPKISSPKMGHWSLHAKKNMSTWEKSEVLLGNKDPY